MFLVFGEVLTFSLFLMQLLGVFRALTERERENRARDRNTLEFVFEFVFMLYAIVIIANLLMNSIKCS